MQERFNIGQTIKCFNVIHSPRTAQQQISAESESVVQLNINVDHILENLSFGVTLVSSVQIIVATFPFLQNY